MKISLVKISFILLFAMINLAPMGCAQSNYYDIFVRPEKLEEVKKQEGIMWGVDVIEEFFGAGMIRFWPPQEIAPHPRVPEEPYLGKFQTRITFIHNAEDFPITFRILRLDVSDPVTKFVYGDYYDSKSEQYRKFTHPSEISEDRIVEKITGNSIKMILDIPKEVKSFDIAFETEVSYEGKTEIIKFQNHFVRSKYRYIPPD